MNGGALTSSFIQVMKKQPGITYGKLLHSMRSLVLEANKNYGNEKRFHKNHPQHYVNVSYNNLSSNN